MSQTTNVTKSFRLIDRLIVIVAVCLVVSLIRADGQTASSPEPGTLLWKVREAQRKHQAALHIDESAVLWGDPKTLEGAIASCSLLLVDLVDSVTTYTSTDVVTWYKFRLIETLHKQPTVLEEPLPDGVPASLLPVLQDEFLFYRFTGTITLEGVAVSEDEGDAQSFKKDTRHLLYVTMRSPVLATATYGPKGLYWVDDHDAIRPLLDAPYNQLNREMNTKTKGTLDDLRTFSLLLAK
jgi:hypothetical protein